MFGSIISDEFAQADRKAVVEALEDICSAKDTYGWGSNALYMWYDPTVNHFARVKYIGLASNIAKRIEQHLGLVGKPGQGSKANEINQLLGSTGVIGLSVFAQSPIDATGTAREQDISAPQLGGGVRRIMAVEGEWIEEFRRVAGQLPPWNKIGGSNAGQRSACPSPTGELFLVMCGVKDTIFKARRSLRSLSKDLEATGFEADVLHPARMHAMNGLGPIGAAGGFISEQDVINFVKQGAARPAGTGPSDYESLQARRAIACGYLQPWI